MMELFFDICGIVFPFIVAGGLIYLTAKNCTKLF